MKIEWNFDEESFKKAIDGVKKQDASEDFLGNLYIGHICIDLKLMDYEDNRVGVVLDGDLYVGGVDTGYAHTQTNNLPYDCTSGIQAMNRQNVDSFKTLDEFKEHVINEAINCVNKSNNKILIEKMNMESIFDWS